MLQTIKKILLFFTVIICIITIIILTIRQNNKIVINSIEPTKMECLDDFPMYEGKPTMSIYGKGFKVGDNIYINDEKQDTTFGNEGWITCFIDEAIINYEGQIKIEVKRLNTRLPYKSNIIKIYKKGIEYK